VPDGELQRGGLELDDWDAPRRRKRHLQEPPKSRERGSGPSYYDIPMLKPHAWTPEVTVYFFLGGLSVGAFVLSRVGERMGGETFPDLTRTGAYVSAAAILPCAPLLIVDLGDPKRFHHMLRVWKPTSPMNLGSWVLTGFTPLVLLAALREALRDRSDSLGELTRTLNRPITLLTDVAGIPLGLLLSTYTGILLSATAVPLWGRNPHLGTLFTASAMNTGVAAVHLALQAQSSDKAPEQALARIKTTTHAAKSAALAAFTGHAGKQARTLTHGKAASAFWIGVVGVGLVLPVVLDAIPARGKVKRALNVASAAATLVGGFALRWSIMEAGRESGGDPQAAREASRPRQIASAAKEIGGSAE